MSTPAVFSADYYNFEYKKGLKVCRLVFEVPYEHAGLVRDVLGDPPLGGAQVRVAIARLKDAPSGAEESGPGGAPDKYHPHAESAKDQDSRRTFSSLPKSQQAALKLADGAFSNWLVNQYCARFRIGPDDVVPIDDGQLKRILNICSKKELDIDEDAGKRWLALLTDFDTRMYR